MENITPLLCKIIIEHANPMPLGGLYDYKPCNRKVKYKIKFKNPINGKMKEENVCGIHFKSAQKSATSLKNTSGYDCNFEFEEIKDTSK